MPKKKGSVENVEQQALLLPSEESQDRVISSDKTDLDKTKRMLQMMIRMRLDKEFAAVLIEQVLPLSVDQLRYLVGPVVVHRNGWSDTIPEWLVFAAYEDRLNVIFEECQTGKITGLAAPADMLAAMYPASMEAPMHHDWCELYFYLGGDVLPRFGKIESTEAFFKHIGHDYRPPTLREVRQDYDFLSRDVRRKVANAAKDRGFGVIKRQSKAKPKAETTPRAEAQTLECDVVQTSFNLFNI
ncbi:hypothetical protein H6G00_01845 [Leptolyngbya sp. FACHB-541]|uniref:hypothetical protein n=1 Tax=Leptolyngbya sp. FACHB-541 TaxID=2692810 RepID=UPI001683736F|nr:hypothetical protein [Leptolyngbya sp. FACHB-541]MBD1995374.1 hypothetical protein [Leptolyngbya sp. FACHB-541]